MKVLRGFTLVELLVALLVFSLLAMAGYRGLNTILQTRAHLDRETRKYQALSRFFARLDGEVAQAINRPVRLPDGTEQAAWIGFPPEAGGLEDARLMFTRAGGTNAEGVLVPPQRVGYRLHKNAVELLRWRVLDRAPNNQPLVDVMLDGVREFNLRYLSSELTWEKQWPLSVVNVPLPKGMEVEVVLMSDERVVRFFALQ